MADRDALRAEFARAAEGFAARTQGRFEALGVAEFARFHPGESVVEVGAGTGNLLALFEKGADPLIGIDLVPDMLHAGRRRLPGLLPAVGEGAALPLRSASFDLVACAQMLHHVDRPVPVLAEMRRVARPTGRVLVIDQAGPESFEALEATTALERLRDPTHAATRPPSAFRIILASAGLRIVDERIVTVRQRLSEWMWPGEFPPERIEAVRRLVEASGHLTGMDFRPEGDDFSFSRSRIMFLAVAA